VVSETEVNIMNATVSWPFPILVFEGGSVKRRFEEHRCKLEARERRGKNKEVICRPINMEPWISPTISCGLGHCLWVDSVCDGDTVLLNSYMEDTSPGSLF